jgi:folate-dependent tRNA-U54 methylase TrmFO/GidA
MVTIIIGGLAGSEAAWRLLDGRSSRSSRCAPCRPLPCKTDGLAELVQQFLPRNKPDNAVGLLKEEMRLIR